MAIRTPQHFIRGQLLLENDYFYFVDFLNIKITLNSISSLLHLKDSIQYII